MRMGLLASGEPVTPLPWAHHDGGRSAADGHGGTTSTGDCVVRAIAIALQRPYKTVYDELTALQHDWAHTSRSKAAKLLRDKNMWHARHGVFPRIIHKYLVDIHKWTWTPTMQIGTGTTTHLAVGEIPDGTLVVNLSRHVAAVIDGTVYDTDDPTRDGTRCVYGYWKKP